MLWRCPTNWIAPRHGKGASYLTFLNRQGFKSIRANFDGFRDGRFPSRGTCTYGELLPHVCRRLTTPPVRGLLRRPSDFNTHGVYSVITPTGYTWSVHLYSRHATASSRLLTLHRLVCKARSDEETRGVSNENCKGTNPKSQDPPSSVFGSVWDFGNRESVDDCHHFVVVPQYRSAGPSRILQIPHRIQNR